MIKSPPSLFFPFFFFLFSDKTRSSLLFRQILIGPAKGTSFKLHYAQTQLTNVYFIILQYVFLLLHFKPFVLSSSLLLLYCSLSFFTYHMTQIHWHVVFLCQNLNKILEKEKKRIKLIRILSSWAATGRVALLSVRSGWQPGVGQSFSVPQSTVLQDKVNAESSDGGKLCGLPTGRLCWLNKSRPVREGLAVSPIDSPVHAYKISTDTKNYSHNTNHESWYYAVSRQILRITPSIPSKRSATVQCLYIQD